jgi:hypothetical protein
MTTAVFLAMVEVRVTSRFSASRQASLPSDTVRSKAPSFCQSSLVHGGTMQRLDRLTAGGKSRDRGRRSGIRVPAGVGASGTARGHMEGSAKRRITSLAAAAALLSSILVAGTASAAPPSYATSVTVHCDGHLVQISGNFYTNYRAPNAKLLVLNDDKMFVAWGGPALACPGDGTTPTLTAPGPPSSRRPTPSCTGTTAPPARRARPTPYRWTRRTRIAASTSASES